MPVLQQAQAENPDVVFLFANQGESAETVRHFLQGENLRLDNLLFDNGGQLSQQVGSVALPTTVFYTAEGRLLGSHLGELSRGSLARYLEAFEPAAAAPQPGVPNETAAQPDHPWPGPDPPQRRPGHGGGGAAGADPHGQEKGARILGSFDALDGLRGYAAEYQNQGMALYLTPDSKHVLTGHLFDAQGKDLSREPLERLV